MESDAPRVAFVCVQNAGRSQMSAAFARREADRRGLDVEVVTGGTDPADAVHPEVVEVMDERGIDLSGREPREISTDELESCRLVATMGCSTLDLDADVDVRDWALPDPDGEDLDRVREIRDEVERRVREVFDELESGTAVEE
jgi:protein-tyrosine-phosphatase